MSQKTQAASWDEQANAPTRKINDDIPRWNSQISGQRSSQRCQSSMKVPVSRSAAFIHCLAPEPSITVSGSLVCRMASSKICVKTAKEKSPLCEARGRRRSSDTFGMLRDAANGFLIAEIFVPDGSRRQMFLPSGHLISVDQR